MSKSNAFKLWMWQQFTAIYLGVFLLALLVFFTVSPPLSYSEWIDSLRRPFFLCSSVIFFIALGIHAWIGVKSIILDYVHAAELRLLFFFLISLSLFFLIMRALLILIRL